MCNFSTKTKFCLDVHFNTKKHKRNEQPYSNIFKKNHQCKTYNNEYSFASGLYCHVKKCRGIRRDITSKLGIIDELKKINNRIDAISNEINLSKNIKLNEP